MQDEEIAALSARLELLEIRHFAFESVFVHLIGRVLPVDQALDLVVAMRESLEIYGPPDRLRQKLQAEEHVQDLADRIEQLRRTGPRAKG